MLRYFAFTTALVVAHVVLFMSAAYAGDLTQAQVISIAKAATAKECSNSTPCTYDARLEDAHWYVHVQFTTRNSPSEQALPYPGGHEVLVLDHHGKILRTIPGE